MRDFTVGRIEPSIARKIIVAHHYSHAWPTGNFVSFGIWTQSELVGCITYGWPANSGNWKSIPGLVTSRELAELTRLWIADRAPRFLESRAIAVTIRAMKQREHRALVSYADPSHGHVGTIYQATNWIFVGEQGPSKELCFADATLMHKRAAFDRYGTNNAKRLNSRFPGIHEVSVPGKLKYLYPLDEALRPALEAMRKPYPKRACSSEIPESPSETGGSTPTQALHSGVSDG